MAKTVPAILCCTLLAVSLGAGVWADEARFKPIAGDAQLFRKALDDERPAAFSHTSITGVTIPHHLLAADLMARGVWAAAGNSYERIVVISPDHFRRSRRPVATTRRGFETALGPVDVDKPAVDTLIRSDLVEESDLFDHEHGIGAVLPFLHYVFPTTPIVPIALGIGTNREDWDRAVDLIRQIVSPRTLVVQSTDYSHYLLSSIARAMDQETLNVIATADPAVVATLQQSNQLDSKASQYVQMRLQQEVFHSSAAVIANRNSVEYAGQNGPSTSYIVTVYSTEDADLSTLVYADQQITFFGGDVFLGRWLTVPLLESTARKEIVDSVRRLTGGQSLIVNLEGVLTAHPPTGIPQDRHVMDDALAGPLLKNMNVTGADLANNHAFDLGPDGLIASKDALKARGIIPLQNMAVTDFGKFRLIALNFVGSGDFKGYPVVERADIADRRLTDTDIAHVCGFRAPAPFIAFVHWGEEYTSSAGQIERNIAEALGACGVSLVIGAHTHRASSTFDLIANGEALMYFSLGNLVFDQRSPRGSGAVVELRVFKQGTFAARLIPAPNIYEAAVAK